MDQLILIKYLKGSASPKEESDIRRWLADDEDGSHREYYKQMHNIYNGMMLHGSKAASRSIPVRRATLKRFLAYSAAAAAAVLLVAGLLIHEKHSTIDMLSSKTETIMVPPGQSMELRLEDGPSLWLNVGTEVEKPSVFARKERRLVVRTGEILVDVAKDAERPFYVETFSSTVKVLGTRFDVEVDESSGICNVALLRGRVEARDNMSGMVYGLSPDEKLCFDRGNVYKERIANRSSVDCWTEGLVDVTGLQFDALMHKLERAFNVKISVERKDLPTISYTRGKIRISDGIEHALEVLQIASDFKYERDFNTNTIVIK